MLLLLNVLMRINQTQDGIQDQVFYRNVNLLTFEKEHILLNSIKISTLSYSDKTISVELDTTSVGNVEVDFYQNEKLLKHCTFNSNKHVEEVVTLSDALLWSSDSPNLVKAKFKFKSR